MLDKLNMVTKALIGTGAIQSTVSAMHVESSAKDALAALRDVAVHTAHRLRAKSDEILRAYGIEAGENVLRTILDNAAKENDAIRSELGIGEDADVVATIREPKRPRAERDANQPEELAERLFVTFDQARAGMAGPSAYRDGIRAIIAELAKEPCGIPKVSETCERLDRVFGTRPLRRTVRLVLEHVNDTVAPVLAAKDAELRRLNEQLVECHRLLVTRVEADRFTAANVSIAELESRTPANEVTNAERQQYETTIETLQTHLVDAHRALDRCGVSANKNYRPLALTERIAELEKQVAKRDACIEAHGKNPGDVYREVHEAHYSETSKDAEREDFHRIYRESEDVAVNAVLRAFGDGAESLRRVRERASNIETKFVDGDGTRRDHTAKGAIKDFVCIVDAELAKLEPK